MLKNYFKVAWRNFRRNMLLSVINLGGLTIGIASVLLIGMYVYSEMGYDSFHKNRSSLFRVGFRFWQNGKLLGENPVFTPPFGDDARNEFGEVKSFVRISTERTGYISFNDKTIKAENIHHADSTFFRLFSFNLLQGNAATCLAEPFSIVLTTTMAKNLFGDDKHAIGKIVRLDNQADYTVTGIAEPAPVHSHISFNALLSFSTLYKEAGNFMDWNGGEQYITYLLLQDGVQPASLEKKFPAFMWKHINQDYSTHGFKIDASLQPLTAIHLRFDDNSATLRTNIYVFSTIALLILVISCFNYINLTTAQAITRYKEIGVRKVLGAVRTQLIKQFLAETILLTLAAFMLSLGIVALSTPVYQQLIGKTLPAINAAAIPALLLLLAIVLAVGIIAGGYVAFYLSSFNVIKIFKALFPNTGKSLMKKALIVSQFAITIALAGSTYVISLQLSYSKHADTGLDRNHILVLPLVGKTTQAVQVALQQALSQIPGIQQTSAVSEIPFNGITNNGFIPEGDTKAMTIHQLDADYNFLKTFGTTLTAGEYFSKERSYPDSGYVINETLAKTLDWNSPLGKTISRNGTHKVIGVIKDFHFASLHDKIEPLIITNKPWEDHYSFIAVKYQSGNIQNLLKDVKQKWSSLVPGAAFDYWFLDDAFNTLYKSEERFQDIFFYFSALSIILCLSGVFGLVALMIRQRTKEMGIRKVLGAGIVDVIRLTVTDFIILVILSTAIATPVAWYYIHGWIQNFAYRINTNWWVFVASGFIILLVTAGIVSVQSLKAAMANPVKSLRTE